MITTPILKRAIGSDRHRFWPDAFLVVENLRNALTLPDVTRTQSGLRPLKNFEGDYEYELVSFAEIAFVAGNAL
jgi:hypothetical protein